LKIGQYQAIWTQQAWSVKDLLYGFRENFSRGTQQVVPSGHNNFISANHSAGFDSFALSHGATDYKKNYNSDLTGRKKIIGRLGELREWAKSNKFCPLF